MIIGFWERGTDCIIDVRTFGVNKPSYQPRQPYNVIKPTETGKKKEIPE